MILRDGVPRPGLKIEITPVVYPMNPGGLVLDDSMRRVMRDRGVHGFVLSPRVTTIRGDSWEMAAVMAMMGRPGAYSGSLDLYSAGLATFGPVRGVNVKRRLGDFQTSKDISALRVSPSV